MTRMDKYLESNNPQVNLRSKKNAELYKEIDNDAISSFTIPSNAKVLDSDASNIDIDKIKEILEKRYTKETKKMPTLSPTIVEEEEPSLGDTKEYDLNAILEKARKTKEIDYEKERFKKLRDTQYDILKSLHLENEDDAKEKEEVTKRRESQKEDVIKLMDTIALKEAKQDSIDPLDLFTDLKGNNEETKVMGNLKEEMDKVKDTEEVKNSSVSDLDASFYTNTLSFTQSDFDDFNDLKEDVKSSKTMIHILVVILTLVVLAIVVILANNIFSLGWF